MLTLKQFVSDDLLDIDVLALSIREFLIITIDKSRNYQVIVLENILWAVSYVYCITQSSRGTGSWLNNNYDDNDNNNDDNSL